MLLAHLITARAVPGPGVVTLVAAVVFGLAAATAPGTRWRLALTVGLAQVTGHGLLALMPFITGSTSPSGCLPAVGRGAELGLRLALFRPDAACSQGDLAIGPTTTAAVAAVLTASLILLAHGAIAILAARLVTGGELAVRTLRHCTTSVSPVLACPHVPVITSRQVTVGSVTAGPVRPRCSPRPVSRRGPPTPLRAVVAV